MARIWQLVLIFAVLSPLNARFSSQLKISDHKGTNIRKSVQESHDLIIGQRQDGDQFMYQVDVYKPWECFKVVVVEKCFSVDDKDNITEVRALDKFTDGHGAYAELISGGPGYSNVTLRFTSQKWYGIDFLVEIYALVPKS